MPDAVRFWLEPNLVRAVIFDQDRKGVKKGAPFLAVCAKSGALVYFFSLLLSLLLSWLLSWIESNSTSKTRVELGPISGPGARSP